MRRPRVVVKRDRACTGEPAAAHCIHGLAVASGVKGDGERFAAMQLRRP